ncbi:MAG: DNA polymerase III subunit delta' C-terminal domain-containing protein [bacterium]
MNDNATDATNNDIAALPWTLPAWQRVAGGLDALHHGLLITGASGVAKREFAIALGQLLLCAEPSAQRACGRCRNCALFVAGTHPDFHLLTTELEWRDGRIALAAQYCNRYQDVAARDKRANPGKVIPVDQVRLLIERFAVHAHSAPRKVALIMPADRMNANAANALLKLLEEPPADSFLILVSALPGYLPATVRSRCMQIAIAPPSRADADEWLRARMPPAQVELALALAHGAPLDALQMHQDGFLESQRQFLRGIGALAAGKTDALELAAKFARHDFAQWIDWLHRFGCDLIRARCAGAPPSLWWQREIQLDCARLPVEYLFALYDKIGYYRRIAREPLNAQLAAEELTLSLQRLLRT